MNSQRPGADTVLTEGRESVYKTGGHKPHWTVKQCS